MELESPPAGPSSPFVWKYCRMCALEVRQGVYIFGEEGRRLQIPEKIRKTVAILVLEEDSLPKKICTDCCTKLESYAQFKDSIVDAQEKLSSIARSIEKSEEQGLLQLRNRHQLRSPKRLKLYSSASVNQSSSHVLLPAPSIMAAEPDMDDPAIECDEAEPPSSVVSLEGDENETPKCFAGTIEAVGRDDEANSQEPSQGSSQPLTFSTKQQTHGQLHPEQNDISKDNSADNSPAASASSDGDAERENLETEAYLICGRCTAQLNEKNSLMPHHTKHHNVQEDPMYGCSACPRITSSYDAIRQHIYRHRMDGTFKCPDCEKSYPTKDQLYVHISSKHNPAGNKAFGCSTCGKKYSTNIALTAHHQKKHPLDTGYSNTSDSTDQNNRNISKIVSSSDISDKDLNQTDKTSPSKLGDEDREEVLDPDTLGSNTVCPGTSQTQSNQQDPLSSSSVKNKTNPSNIEVKEEGHWKCDYCDKILHSKGGYDNHIKVHNGRRYSCETCGVTYTQRATLTHHIRIRHTNIDKEFECTECKKRFKTFRQLAGHQKIHEKSLSNVICPVCEKRFSNMVSLKTHMKFHRGSKKFLCSECPKSFFTKLKLEEHKNSHTGRRPLGCPAETCSSVFSCNSNYAKHFKRHHPELLGPRGNMVPQPKVVGNSNAGTSTKSPTLKSKSETMNGTTNPSNDKSGCSPTDTIVPLALGKDQQPLSNTALNQGSSQDFSQQSCSANQALISGSPAHCHPTTVIQVPYPANLSTTGISQKSYSQLTSSPCTYSNSVLTSVNSNHQHPPSAIHSSPPTSSILQVTSHPNLPLVTGSSSSGTGHGAHSHVINLHSSNLSTTDNNMSLAHSQSSIPSGASLQAHSHHPVTVQGGQTAHMNTHSTISTHTQTVGVQSHHPLNSFQIQPQPHTQSVWQPVMLPSSKTYNHPNNTTNGLATINGLDLLDCAGVIVAAHSSEPLPSSSSNNHSHGQHQQGNYNVMNLPPVTAAHHLTMSHTNVPHLHQQVTNLSSSGHSNVHQGSMNHHGSALHIPHPTPSAHSSIPLSSAGTVTVPNFVPSSQQNEPMELSYKLDSNNFQDMPMELTKVFQRDPLELCVRQDFGGAAQPLMDLSSRVVNVSVGGNSSINVSSMSMNLNGNTNSSSHNHYGGTSSGSGTNTTTVLSVPYHKTVEMVERELSLNDFTGAFRQPIDLIARSDEHSHELRSEGNLVDLSLRSSFGQDQTASSFLRELIDLSARSDSFHGEVNLTNKQQHPQQASSAHSQPQLHQLQQAHTSTGQHHTPKPGNPSISHHNHHGGHHGNPHHHHHHHIQTPSQHQSGSSSGGPGGVSLQNVIYPDTIFNLQHQ